MYLIGLDNGGTSTKAAVFDVNGNEVATAGRHTKLITPKPGYTERDMEELWLANCACVREALEKAGIDGKDVLGIAVCGHGKGMYAWGKDNKPAYNGIISTDNRAWKRTLCCIILTICRTLRHLILKCPSRLPVQKNLLIIHCFPAPSLLLILTQQWPYQYTNLSINIRLFLSFILAD